jgi:hypothetical protein
VIGAHLNSVAELEAARLNGRDGLIGGHAQFKVSCLIQSGAFSAAAEIVLLRADQLIE